MKASHLAVVVPIDPAETNGNATRTEVWQKTAELLMTQLGKRHSRFEPAVQVWKQTVGQPFGVVMGKKDPAMFLYFYAAAKAHQEAAIRYHMAGFLDGIEPISKNEQAGVSVYAVEVKDDGKDMAPHMLWHIAMITGELLPDCGIYYLREKRAVADDEMDKQVLSHLE